MKSKNKWLVLAIVFMILSFVMSGFFFLKSGLINLEDGSLDQELVYEINIFNLRMNKIFNFPLTDEEKALLFKEEIKKINASVSKS